MLKSFALSIILLTSAVTAAAETLRAGVFSVDVSPPIGSPVAYVPARSIEDPLSARGVVLLGAGDPIVLCAVDFVGIGNEGYDAWREALAKAAGTTPDRVTVHALHQHDACRCDFTIERIMEKHGMGGQRYDNPFLKDAIARTAEAAGKAAENTREITHLGYGQAKVEKVASNRRILGEDGNVEIVRYSATKDPRAIAAPEGLVDHWLRSVSLWSGEEAVVVLTYYATHPQSHYRKGDVTCEFVGLARNAREAALGGVPHIHFTGAAGNITAGKYNDGSPENRPVLTSRMQVAMAKAWEATNKSPLVPGDVAWRSQKVQLPPARHLDETELNALLDDESAPPADRHTAARKLAWLQRCQVGVGIDLTALRLGKTWLLHLPAEVFVEYQLAAQEMRPNDNVCVAAYADYGPGYIGTEIAYSQGGYETSERVSFVAPEVEGVLISGMRRLLE